MESRELTEALQEELTGVRQQHRDLKLLVVLVDDSEPITDQLYNQTKLITETEIGSFVTQFINCKKGIAVPRRARHECFFLIIWRPS